MVTLFSEQQVAIAMMSQLSGETAFESKYHLVEVRRSRGGSEFRGVGDRATSCA